MVFYARYLGLQQLPFVILLCLAGFVFASLSDAQALVPFNLSVEYLREPDLAVISSPQPKLAWEFPQAGIKQTGYRILVASSPQLLNEADADCWDTGVVGAANSVNVRYNGNTLDDNASYYWKLKVWGQGGVESMYSNVQRFNTGVIGAEHSIDTSNTWVQLTDGNWVLENRQSPAFERIEPQKIIKRPTGGYFIDFGKSSIGTLSFTASTNSSNAELTILLGELAAPGLTVDSNLRQTHIGYTRLTTSLQKGTHQYTVQLPRRVLTYPNSVNLPAHIPEVVPFRYAQVTGNNAFTLNAVSQQALVYYFNDSASLFQSTSPQLDSVWDLCKYTLQATPFLGIYADGNRERMPYEADAYIQQRSHFNADREYAIGKATQNFLLSHASWPTEWQMHMLLMAWDYFMYTGDTSFLAQHYVVLKRKTLVELTDTNGLISSRTGLVTPGFLQGINYTGQPASFKDIVDWPKPVSMPIPNSNQTIDVPGETDGFVFTDYNTVVNAFHQKSLTIMSRIAAVLGNAHEAQYFRQLAIEHKQAFNQAFFDHTRGIYVDGLGTSHASLHANMFPLAFGLVDTQLIETVATYVAGKGMACSVYGAQYLLQALYNGNKENTALQLMTAKTDRSWLHMLHVGSSMTTEAWDEKYKPNLTWNHAWGTAPANVIARNLMGIEPITAAFGRFKIEPKPAGLKSVYLMSPSLRGSIEVSLQQAADAWILNISVPGNSTAELWLPSKFSTVCVNDVEFQVVNSNRKAIVLEAGKHHVQAY